MSAPCTAVDTWLYEAADIADNSLLPDAIVDHVANCPACRVALVALIADRVGPTGALQDLACSAVEAELPAFVDFERSQGLVAAARAFPDVWWHTLVCPDCDELYRALHELADEPLAVAAETPHWPTGFELEVELHPAMIRQLLGAHEYLGVEWGEAADDTLVAEQGDETSLLQVSLRHEPPDHLALVVRTHPPAQGVVLLTLGEASYHRPLDLAGCAIFSGLTTALFAANRGPIKLILWPLTP